MKNAPFVMGLLAWVLVGANPGQTCAAEPEKYRGRKYGEWLATLKKDTFQNRTAVREALGPEGPFAKKALPDVIRLFPVLEPYARSNAIVVLSDYGSAAVPNLVDALKDSQARIRAGAAATFAYIRPNPTEAVPALIEALTDKDREVRQDAAKSLGNMRRVADKIIPALVTGLGHPDAGTREACAEALGHMPPKAGPVVEALARAVKDSSRDVQSQAIDSIGRIGPAAFPAVPALMQLFRDNKEPAFRSSTAFAFGRIGPAAKDAVPLLVAALDDSGSSLQLSALNALAEIGPSSAPAVSRILAIAKEKRVKDDYSGRRDIAIYALGRIGPAARDAVPFLIGEVKGAEHPGDATGAIRALGGIGPEARAALPLLTAIARDRKPDPRGGVRKWAAEAVAKIDPVFAAKEKIELECLDIRLGKMQTIALQPRAKVTDETAKHIKDLIAKLAELDKPDVGLSPTLNGTAFAPLPAQARMQSGLITNHNLGTTKVFRELVEAGPTALPFLLDALGDEKATRLKIRRDSPFSFFGVGGDMPEGNPFNPREKKALEIKGDEPEYDTDSIESYTVKVGDVCFVAIGQIVGRRYQAVQYIPSGIVAINSASTNREFRDKVRAAWSGNDPAKVLLNSLLIDYATEGVFNGESLDGWGEGSDYQIAAATRLLYYFPNEAAPIIAARLKSLDVKKVPEEEWMKQTVRNGVRAVDFIKAISWCQAAPIQEALRDITKRTDDPEIKKAILGGKK